MLGLRHGSSGVRTPDSLSRLYSPWSPHAREVHGCFFDVIDLNKVIYLVVKEGTDGADPEARCSPGKIRVLSDVTGINVDVPVRSLPIFPPCSSQ